MRFITWTFLLFICFFLKTLITWWCPPRSRSVLRLSRIRGRLHMISFPSRFRYFFYVLGWYNFLLLIRALVFWLYFQTVFRLCIFTQAKQGQTRASHIRKMCVEKQIVYILQLLSANILFSHYLIELDSSTRWISSLFLFLLCQYFDPIISHPDNIISVLHMWW